MEYTLLWNADKNKELIERYGFGFERVLIALQEDCLLDDRKHPNVVTYGHQRQLVIEIEEYAYVVPYVIHEKEIFFKTFFPSRKATKQYFEYD